ncbi:hypothetical protein G9F32_08560 [Acinetobacter sp. 194]|uniref:vWA domain-containing protein n=1 Tax=Acinetobacter shaoyimingii TaxID=2715164 RepID=UPI00140CC775|nr:VWA domain-containing protein [Acinetobacter shaoyimingii]NHB58073.1 hypothetical protein [Acinetobacter shaoyimingii]
MNIHHMIKNTKKITVSVFAATATLSICVATTSYATDMEIYKVPEDIVGTTTLMFMLDVSGSMNTRDSGQTLTRLELLKQGVKDVLLGTTSTDPIADKMIIGLADFDASNGRIRVAAKSLDTPVGGNYNLKEERYYRYTVSGSYRYKTCEAWHDTKRCKVWSTQALTSAPSVSGVTYETCYISNASGCRMYYVPRSVTKRQRHALVEAAEALNATNGATPTAYAYAEVAAYLMGTLTVDGIYQQVGYSSSNGSDYYGCNTLNTSYTQYSGAGLQDTGKILNVLTCRTLQSRLNQVPSEVSENIEIGQFTHIVNGSERITYYKLVPSNLTTSGYSGWTSSISEVKDSYNYKMPQSIKDQLSSNAKKECSGQGIYFLTDGEPNHGGTVSNSTGRTGTAYQLMRSAMGSKGNIFHCADSQLGKRFGYTYNTTHWNCIGNFAEALLDESRNPVGLRLKTAVVGFGNGFSGSSTQADVEDAKVWGNLGGGGWYSGSNSSDVVNSVNDFIKELVKDIPSMSTGSSVIPTDALNPSQIQNFVYFPQFEPKVNPSDLQQVWYGNLKKYFAVNNGVFGDSAGTREVVSNGKLIDVADIWNGNRNYVSDDPLYSKYGARSRLKLGSDASNNTQRKLLTDYKFENGTVSKDLGLVQIKHTYTVDAKTKADITKSRALMSLLGYEIPVSVADSQLNGYSLTNVTPKLAQIGASLHSDPILLTQGGKIEATRVDKTKPVQLSTVNREDYVLFGTSQGLIHVVSASDIKKLKPGSEDYNFANISSYDILHDGEEQFVFVPKEIIENQSETFKNKGGNLTGGREAMYYGMDGTWTAFTNYVAKDNGYLTVKSATRSTNADTQEVLTGRQWVYGGMRMGGRSYYSLDLTDIDAPHIKFHIDPNSGKVYSKNTPVGKAFNDLTKMGQSWSKPTIGYVNWNGKRKLVMFVGGGYDAGGDNGDGLYTDGVRRGYAGYENYNYVQPSDGNNIGAGVYMFDADNGDLLWRASAKNSADSNVKYATNSALKYSVASPIQTVDRNNDGLVDHLYFGDLAGQGFRVDINNETTGFASQVTQILDLHKTDGTSPRFYNEPLFTSHRNASAPGGANIVMAIFASGNKSSPLAGTDDSPIKKNTVGLEYDGVFAVYDYDAYNGNGGKYPYGVSAQNPNIRTLASESIGSGNPDVNKLLYINNANTGAVVNKTSGWGGWYYLFKNNMQNIAVPKNNIGPGIIKALRPMIAMENNLYVTQFNPLDNGTSSSCGAGVKGNTFATRICLPLGKCLEDATYVYNLGAGDVSLNVGSGGGNTMELYVPNTSEAGIFDGKTCTGTECNSDGYIPAGGPIKLIPNKWYERYSRRGSGG